MLALPPTADIEGYGPKSLFLTQSGQSLLALSKTRRTDILNYHQKYLMVGQN